MNICGVDSLMARVWAHTSYVQVCGFFLTFIGWCLCIYATSIGQWRQWHIEKSTKYQTDVLWIGIWDACYDSAIPEDDHYDQNCKLFSSEQDVFLPKEIFVAQDLMVLGAVLATLALGIFFLSYWIIIKDEKIHRRIAFLTIEGFLCLTTGTLVLIPVAWNMLSVLNNKKIDFPESFDMPSRPKKQHVGIAIYLGLVSSVLLIVTGLLFLGNKCLLIIHKRVHPLDPEKGSEHSSGKETDYCSRCGCSLNVTIPGYSQHPCEAGRHKRKETKPGVSFQIHMGPIPEQQVGL